ncbi:replicative DNA helicase [Metabacillus halosaccharovorans]|uniref:replicative DNA helicase n=1 Tax=Metabacillus halosaccharovorans TaxID=930124 RepID=UPI00203A9D55|nr:replicative DNA helicase [Metabacillus halosaccharovorans]MCM3439411.1 replicative DNA helicase [Metabacillus halosaccharovorans]
MELNEMSDITSGFRERMRRLALFDPLYELDRKKVKDYQGEPIDMKGLGLLTLLFFFEQKIIRNQKVGMKDLAKFLQKLTERQYILDGPAVEEIASAIIQTFRPTTGKKRTYPFFDWETYEKGQLDYSLLKAKAFDSKTNTQYYTLDEDGLELVFATKEFYSEFQLSINQLMLRKQLEKGEFRGALRQINEMRIDVESLNERMVKLRHEIQRSIVSEETFDRYKQLLEDIHARLERENEEFSELRQFVKDTKDRLYEKDYHQKEVKTYAYVLEISNQLEEVHYEHSRLLEQSIELKNHTLKAAQESLYYTGIDAFNFDQDINARIIGTPLPLEAMKGLLHPFLPIYQEQQWSPLTVFAEQNIREDQEETVDYGFLTIGNQRVNDYHERLRQNYGYVMNVCLQAIEAGCQELAGVLEYVRKTEDKDLLHQRFFYDFWLILHQRSPIVAGKIENEDDEQNHSMDDALAQLGQRTLMIKERPETLHVTERFSIQNMDIMLEEESLDEL